MKRVRLIIRKIFLGRITNLTVSGQLEAELAALALSEVYTFGPTFRAENSNTSRHLAEFWMIEPEMAFYDIHDDMDLAEEMLKFIINMHSTIVATIWLSCKIVSMKKKNQKSRKSVQQWDFIEKLKFVLENEFERITYTQAIDILKNSNHNKKKKFQFRRKMGY